MARTLGFLVDTTFLIASALLAFPTFASNQCFKDPAVEAILQEARDTDPCFADDAGEKKCFLHKMNNFEQTHVSMTRLVPFDRSANNLMNNATGAVVLRKLGKMKKDSTGSGQKISRCHVLTSAHVLYGHPAVPINDGELLTPEHQRMLKLDFYAGQTCESRPFFASRTEASVYFKMTQAGKDVRCPMINGVCDQREFLLRSDVAIIRLHTYDKSSKDYFRIDASNLKVPLMGVRVNCWGYPGNSPTGAISDEVSNMFLWHQSNAKAVRLSEYALETSAASFAGMSGGACVQADRPEAIIGILNRGGSYPTLTPREGRIFNGNEVSTLMALSERYKNVTGKSIEDLDKECD